MACFIFDHDIFEKKFIQADGFKNRAKSLASGCDSICPNNTDSGNVYKGYTSTSLLADTLHNVFGEVLSLRNNENIEDRLRNTIIEQVEFNNDENVRNVFWDLIENIYFDAQSDLQSTSPSLLRYLPESKQKDFGKLVYDVFLDDETKTELKKLVEIDSSPLDDLVNISYGQLNALRSISTDQEYSRVFSTEMSELFELMNTDFRVALANNSDSMMELEFLLSYYLFIYLTQFAIRLDADLKSQHHENIQFEYPLFKGAKESIGSERECTDNGWKRVEKKTQKIFRHMIVLNMLNCHTNDSPYLTYSEIYHIYDENPDERPRMDDSIDYIINKYTVEFKHDTDNPDVYVDFSVIDKPSSDDVCSRFREKVIYLYKCVSHQLDSKQYRQNVVSYAASNYNHILKMRFVKPWSPYGNMMMISYEDFITMVSICQRSSTKMVEGRGIQISDLFSELARRGMCMDGITKKYFIDYLVRINLIDSKCDSEEAQYVKQIQ